MVPREKRMLDKKYEIKADISKPEIVKVNKRILISPTGNQYRGNVMEHLRMNGISSIAEAKKKGWTVK